MRILGIDTSSRFLCIGIYDDKFGIYEYRMDLGKKHSYYILPTLKRISEALKIKLGDFDYFAVGLGPGSFTGIRIGLSVIKGFAYALKKSLIGISSLDILACNAKQSLYLKCGLSSDDKNSGVDNIYGLNKAKICPVIDAKRNLLFCSLYSIKHSHLRRIMPYKLITLDELMKKTAPQTIFFGDAIKLYKHKIINKIRTAILLDEDYWYPKPGSIIELARERIATKKIDSLDTIRPIYLYPKECQIRK